MTGGGDNTAGKTRPSGHKGTTNLHGLIQDEFGVNLIGTPTAGLGMGGGRRSQSFNGDKSRKPNPVELVDELDGMTGWGKYAPAIERWAEVIDRPAPEPTDDKGRLNPALVEWMMGYPEGWTEGVSRTGQLKALGNSIVPHQAAAAWGHLLGLTEVEA